MEENSKPDIKTFLNANQYLLEYYRHRKAVERQFSYERWARELGVSSKSYLRFAILGKRVISETLAQKISETLGFSELDKEYFILLVMHTQSRNAEKKKFIGRKLIQILKNQVLSSEISPSEGLLQEPINLLVRNSLSFVDVERSSGSLSELFSLPKAVIEATLLKLQQLELADVNEGQWFAKHQVVKIKDDQGNKALNEYHKKSLLKAIALQESASDSRTYRSLSVALSPEDYQSFLTDLELFAQQTLAKYATESLAGKKIYQINVNAIPWTKTASLKGEQVIGMSDDSLPEVFT